MFITGQAVVSTVATLLFVAPPGWSTITVQSGTASTASGYLGSSTLTTSSNGYEVLAQSSVSWAGSPVSKGVNVYGVTNASSAVTFSWLISTGA